MAVSLPPLYEFADWAYRTVTAPFPKEIQDNLATPTVLGFGGTFGVFRGLYSLSERYLSDWFNENVLPWVNNAVGIGVIIVPLAYAIFNPEGALDAVTNHPKYAAGIGGSVSGSLTAVFENNRITQKRRTRDLEKGFKRLRKEVLEGKLGID